MQILDIIRDDFNSNREMVGCYYQELFDDCYQLMKNGAHVYNTKKNAVLEARKDNELHFHNFLEHQLFTRLQEIKYYSEVNIFDTRRLVATSADCISLVQLLVRDRIELMVHFRSSDYDGALPCDLEWVSTLPYKLIRHLTKMKGVPGYEEVSGQTLKNLSTKEVKLFLSFGSIHRTIDERQKSLF